MADRVVVFFDYQNVHGWARRQFLGLDPDPAEGHIDPLRTAQFLCRRRKRDSELTQVRVYRGRPNPEHQQRATAANDRQHDTWCRSPLVHCTRRNLSYPRAWPASPAVEKGIDVSIAVDMIHLGLNGEADVMILFSSDQDLLPAVELLMERRLAHVEVAAWTGAYRLSLADRPRLPWCHNINASDYETLRDHTDYTIEPAREAFPAALRPRLR